MPTMETLPEWLQVAMCARIVAAQTTDLATKRLMEALADRCELIALEAGDLIALSKAIH
jgi:hypothetical protein